MGDDGWMYDELDVASERERALAFIYLLSILSNIMCMRRRRI